MKIRLFIADDHAVFRSGLVALLEQQSDLEVVGEAATGPAAITLVPQHGVDVLLLDISLPGATGPRVAEALLAQRPHLAIVVLTMHDDPHYLRELLKIGARAFVLKHSPVSDLIRAIRIAHAGRRYVDPLLTDHLVDPLVGPARSPGPPVGADLLTPREREVCEALAYGHTNPEIAERLGISIRTVETHRMHIMAKLKIGSRAELVRFAIDHGILRLR